MADDIVYFMHNGEKVSNDPRWLMEREAEKAKARAERAAALDIGEPLDTSSVPPATQQASSTPASSDEGTNGGGTGDTGTGSNDNSSETEGDTSKYDEMNSDALKDEVKARKKAGRELDTKGITKKSQLIELLVADDAAQAAEQE